MTQLTHFIPLLRDTTLDPVDTSHGNRWVGLLTSARLGLLGWGLLGWLRAPRPAADEPLPVDEAASRDGSTPRAEPTSLDEARPLDERPSDELESGVFELPEVPGLAPAPGPHGELPRLPSVAELTRHVYGLSDDDRQFRERVKEVLASPLFERREGLTLVEQGRLSYERFRLLRDALDLRVRDVVERPSRLTTVLELVTTVDGTLFTIMSIHYCLCAGSILRHATPSPEIDAYLAELDSLESVGTFLATELGYGNNVVSLETRADYDVERRELRVSTPSRLAAKFMPNTAMPGVPKLGLVMARLFVGDTEHGVFPVLLRLSTEDGVCPGISITALGEKPAYGLDNAITSFYGVRVPKACLLLGSESRLSDAGEFESSIKSRRERFLSSMEQVQLGRIGLSAVGSAMLGASAFIAIKYGAQRKTFAPRLDDVSVLAYRNYQRDVFTTLAYAYGSRFMVNVLKRQYAKAGDAHDTTFRMTSAAKAHVSYAVERLSRLCRERCGASGLFEENRVAAYACYAQGMITAEGDNQIVLAKLARQMMMGRGYTKLVKESAEMDRSLGDPVRLVSLLRTRERLLLGELRKATVQGLAKRDMFASWNDNINLAIETATAHASRLLAESFWEGVRELHPDSPLRDLLSLFCLQEVAPQLGYFVAEGLILPHEVRSHGKLVDGLCARLHPSALHLAEALDIPNDVLRAPIATDDYVATYAARVRPVPDASPAVPVRAVAPGLAARIAVG
ncbi:MAG TPA: acyl-CoA dehydrogenase [Polyangiaceae bacterium]|nr:acyl-CoA dehydrogenase [Polyangiaceae bacterium]